MDTPSEPGRSAPQSRLEVVTDDGARAARGPRAGTVRPSRCAVGHTQAPHVAPGSEQGPAPTSSEEDYDAVPYEGGCFDHTHPDRLAVMARLFGLAAPPVETARVLELGCANGENLIPMAAQLPSATFVGTDLSARQIGAGRRVVDALGLRNIRLERRDILDLDASAGTFDYIICHGVYSWVPDVVRAKILDVIRNNLSTDGIAYVSYNVYPGWHQRETAREIMMYAAERHTEPAARIHAARSALDFVGGALFEPGSAYGQGLRSVGSTVNGSRDPYVYHDYMERNNRPFWFHEFWSQLVGKGLEYVTDTHLGNGLPTDVSDDVRQRLHALAPNRVQFEQYLDFLRNRSFRQSVVVRSGRQPRRDPRLETVDDLYISGELDPGQGVVEQLCTDGPMVFIDTHKHELSTSHPLLKAVLWEIGQVFPAAMPVPELRARVKARVGRFVASELIEGRGLFAQLLLKLVAARTVDLHLAPPPVAPGLTRRPVASPIARTMATLGPSVPNHRHRMVSLTEIERRLIVLFDGTRTVDDVIAKVIAEDLPGDESPGGVLESADDAAWREIVPTLVRRSVDRFLRRSLLVA
jgi:SAM-dependent methyltransferase